MGTNLYYNGVLFRDVELKRFDQTVEYDESRTDVMFSRFRIAVSSTLISHWPTQTVANDEHVKTIRPQLSPTVAGSTPERIRRISTLLNERGRLFYFYISNAPSDGNSIEPSPPPNTIDIILSAAGSPFVGTNVPAHPDFPTQIPAADIVDVDNGPKPINVRIEKIMGGRAIRVTFEIEVSRKVCPHDFNDQYPPTEPNIDAIADPDLTDGNQAQAERKVRTTASNVLSNRWKITETKGADWHTHRILEGTLRVRDKSLFAHAMRYVVLPPLLRGYQRVNQVYANDPTDLVLKYRIEDRERHEAPPAPAIEWSGHYVESAGKNGAHQTAELQVELIGPPGGNKQDLIGAAGRVLNARIVGMNKALGDTNGSVLLLGASVVEVIGKPIVQLRVQVQHATTENKHLRLRLGQIGKPIGGDANPENIDDYRPDEWPSPLPYDSESPSGVLSCYLQHPCSVYHGAVSWEEGRLTPYKNEEQTPSRPGYNDRTLNVLDHEDNDNAGGGGNPYDGRVYTSATPFDVGGPPDPSDISSGQFAGGAPYTHIKIQSRYHTDTGFVQLPLADATIGGTDATVDIIRLHTGRTYRVFRMDATRTSTTPQIPTPAETLTDENGITEKLISRRVEVHEPEFQVDGVIKKYRVLAEYVYALSRPPSNTESLRRMVSPIDSAVASAAGSRNVPAAQLYTNTLIQD